MAPAAGWELPQQHEEQEFWLEQAILLQTGWQDSAKAGDILGQGTGAPSHSPGSGFRERQEQISAWRKARDENFSDCGSIQGTPADFQNQLLSCQKPMQITRCPFSDHLGL